jgi:chromosome segregation ATPase
LAVKFEKEQLASTCRSQAKKISELEEVLAHKPAELPVLMKAKAYEGKSVNELLGSIEQLSKIVERVSKENEAIKKTYVSHAKYMDALRETKKLKKELDQFLDQKKNVDQYVKQSSKLEAENEKSRRLLKKELSKTTQMSTLIQELQITNEKLSNELVAIRANMDMKLDFADYERQKKRIQELETENSVLHSRNAEKDLQIETLQNPEDGAQSLIQVENRRLAREVILIYRIYLSSRLKCGRIEQQS